MIFAVVWVDHQHARLFSFSEEGMQRDQLHEPDPEGLFRALTARLQPARKILLLGPGTARTQLLHMLQKNSPALAKRVVACEPSDHPSDRQIAAYATKYFQKPVS